MALETGTYINSLVATNPAATDGLAQADDHMRLIKSTIKATFPNLTGAVNATHTELNVLDGGTAATSTTLVDADRIVMNDDGTMKQVALTDVTTYLSGAGYYKGTTSGWMIETSGTSLVFKYNGDVKAKLESDGAITVADNITAYGSL